MGLILRSLQVCPYHIYYYAKKNLVLSFSKAAVFIYFASLSGAIAFGGLLGEKTNNLIGISETLVMSSMAALVFALFAGSPLIITGVTGPNLLYDESLFRICNDNNIDYLSIRFWTGCWMVVIAFLVAMFQGSILVKYFTRFTKELFKALVAFLYIFEALKKLSKVIVKCKTNKWYVNILDIYRYTLLTR